MSLTISFSFLSFVDPQAMAVDTTTAAAAVATTGIRKIEMMIPLHGAHL